jgi:integrase/recombinase XerD
MQIRFKHLVEDTDRHGNIRVYVRLPGRQKVRIRAPFGTDEFIAAYNAAVSEHVSAPPQARAAKAGSFRHVCVLYYASPTFKRLDAATQSWRRRALDSMCEKHADKPVTRMEARHVRALRDERSDQPGAANTRLKALKALFAWLWSTHSRRIDPINRSAKAFCHGEPGAMGSSRMPIARNRRAMAAP